VMRVFDDGSFRFTQGGRPGEYPFLVAEYLPETLQAVILANRVSMLERAAFAAQLTSALVFLSGRSPAVIHRDIKPSNIYVKGPTCVLGDFGLLKRVNELDDGDREILKESGGPGMPHDYRTPDLVAYARNESIVTPKSDVFQLGLVLAELFTGHNHCRPAQAEDRLSPVEVDPIRAIPWEHGGLVASILKRMLTPDPLDRPDPVELQDNWNTVFEVGAEEARSETGRVF